MPKMKTNKSIAKRFKVTATGKLKRHQRGRRHLLSAKSPKRRRHLRRTALVNGATERVYKRLMGV